MEKKTRIIFLYIAFGVVLFVVLMNLSTVISFLKNVNIIVLPVVAGLIISFVLNVPMHGFESLLTRILSRLKRRASEKLVTIISLILTVICIVLVVVLACTLAIPEIVGSVMSIVSLIEAKWPIWIEALKEYNIDTSIFTEFSSVIQWIEKLDLKQLLDKVTSGAGTVLSSLIGAATSTISGVITGLFATIIAFYTLVSKHDLSRQSRKFIYAHLKESHAEKICYVASLTSDTFSKFLSGQCIEAIILGVLILISFSIFKLPYAGLIALLTSVFALVPYVGAIAAGVIGTFLILLVNPVQALISLAIYLGVQFIETQFIYPHVVGTSVGLSPLWTLVGALVGGKLFGLLGIVFFIPLTAVLYTLLRDWTNKKISDKKHNEATKKEV